MNLFALSSHNPFTLDQLISHLRDSVTASIRWCERWPYFRGTFWVPEGWTAFPLPRILSGSQTLLPRPQSVTTMRKTSWQYLHNHRVPSCHFQTCLQKYLLGLWYERLSEVGGPLPSCRPLQKRHSCQSCTEEVRVGDLTIHPSHKDQSRWGIMSQTIEHLNTSFIFKIEPQYFYHCRVGEKSLLTKVLERIFLKQIYHCTTLSTAVHPKN